MERVHPDDRDRVLRALDDHIKGAASHYESEFRLRMPDDSYRWMQSRGIALRDTEGKAIRVAGTFTDSTAERERFQKEIVDPLKQIADGTVGGESNEPFRVPNPRDELHAIGDYLRSMMSHLEETRQKLQTAEQLASVGRLAASVAHEIRNPLTAIRMRLFSMNETIVGEPDFDEDYQVVVAEIERLENIVNDFLEFSRPRALKLETCDIGALLDSSIQVLSPEIADRDIQVTLEDPVLPIVLEVDPNQLMQVFLNLLKNSMEAIGRDGEIRLTVSSRIGDDGESVIIRFQDSGPAIPEHHLNRLFDPFFTTKEEGAGLGLCISAKIIERHGGTLEMEQNSAKGTTFALVLPG